MQSVWRAAAIAITSAASFGIAACDNFKSDKERIAGEHGTTPEAVEKFMEDVRKRAEQPATDPARVAEPASVKPTPASIPNYDIDAYCSRVAEAVGGSYVIEKSCRDQERSSETAIHARTIPHRVLIYCDQVSLAVGGSYAIFGTCADQEMRAAADL